MRKNFIKGLALGMAVCMGVVGCGSNSSSDPGESSSSDGTPEASSSTEEPVAEKFPAYDFGGQTFTILNSNDVSGKNPATVEDDPDSEDDDFQREERQAWIDEIEKKYNCQLEFVDAPAAEWSEIAQELVNAYTAGQPVADIMDVYYTFLAPLTINDILCDMTDYFENDETYNPTNVLNFLGKSYGITSAIAGEGLYYNADMIADAGMKETPAEMFAMGKWDYDSCLEYLTELQSNLGEDEYAMYVSPYYWALFASSANGVKLLGDDGNLCYINDNFIETIEFMQKCIKAGVVINTADAGISSWSYPGETFDAGEKVAIAHRAAWQAAACVGKFNMGFVPYPWGSGVTLDTDKIGEMDAYTTLSESYMQTYYDGQVMAFVKGIEEKADPMELTSMMCEFMGWDWMLAADADDDADDDADGCGWLEDDSLDEELYTWSGTRQVWQYYNTLYGELWDATLSFTNMMCGEDGPRATLQSAYVAEMAGVVEAGLADESVIQSVE